MTEEKKKPEPIKKVSKKYYAMTTSLGIFYVGSAVRDKIAQMKLDKDQNQYEMLSLTDVYPANPVSKGSPVKLENYAFPSSAVEISLQGIIGFYHLMEGALTKDIEQIMGVESKIIKLR